MNPILEEEATEEYVQEMISAYGSVVMFTPLMVVDNKEAEYAVTPIVLWHRYPNNTIEDIKIFTDLCNNWFSDYLYIDMFGFVDQNGNSVLFEDPDGSEA